MAYQSMLLQNLSRADVRHDSFPRVIKRNAIDPDLYARMSREFPNLLEAGKHRVVHDRHTLPFKSSSGESVFAVSPVWREFRDQLFSPVFLDECMDLFHEGLQQLYPRAAARRPRLIERTDNQLKRRLYRIGRRWRDSVFVDGSFNMSGDAYAVGAHYDNHKKLLAGLLYLRNENESEGGDLLMLKRQDPSDAGKLDRWAEDNAKEPLDVIERLEYGANNLCLMINSAQSLHATTAYVGHGHSRRFVYFDFTAYYSFLHG